MHKYKSGKPHRDVVPPRERGELPRTAGRRVPTDSDARPAVRRACTSPLSCESTRRIVDECPAVAGEERSRVNVATSRQQQLKKTREIGYVKRSITWAVVGPWGYLLHQTMRIEDDVAI